VCTGLMSTGLRRPPAPLYAVASMLSVQLGAALSTHLFDDLSPAGSAWLRVAIAAVVLIALTRPRLRAIGWPALRRTAVLGVATAVLMIAYIEAIARIPLGTTAAIEFLGPLGVAAARSHRRSALVWPALAFVGVVGLTEPWRGDIDLVGIGFAVAAAAGWAAYIVLTQRVGAEVEGLQGLALSLTVASVVAAPFAAAPALGGLTALNALESVGLAVLVPLLPFSLELLALRRMRVAAFGTLMAVEPAIAAIIGLVVLSQLPSWWQAAGVALVVVAGVAAQRAPRPPAEPDVPPSTAETQWQPDGEREALASPT
jgi:inner membrane transporter RhtA